MNKLKHLILGVAIMMFIMPTKTLAQSVAKMILVEGGQFTMGSTNGEANEKPTHQVVLNSFYIAEHEVTVAQYKEFVAATGEAMPKGPDEEWMKTHIHTRKFYTSPAKTWWGWQSNFPMHHINWYNAIEYCNWLSAKKGLEKCYVIDPKGGWLLDSSKNGYRLPTEAEWEFAARGGNKSKGYKYSGSNTASDVAWYDDTSKQKGPMNIKTKKPNELGIYDMSGNVWEWCSDYYSAGFYGISPLKNPFNDKFAIYRVLRGGSWHYRGEYATVTSRDGPEPKFSNFNYGFRLAKNK